MPSMGSLVVPEEFIYRERKQVTIPLEDQSVLARTASPIHHIVAPRHYSVVARAWFLANNDPPLAIPPQLYNSKVSVAPGGYGMDQSPAASAATGVAGANELENLPQMVAEGERASTMTEPVSYCLMVSLAYMMIIEGERASTMTEQVTLCLMFGLAGMMVAENVLVRASTMTELVSLCLVFVLACMISFLLGNAYAQRLQCSNRLRSVTTILIAAIVTVVFAVLVLVESSGNTELLLVAFFCVG